MHSTEYRDMESQACVQSLQKESQSLLPPKNLGAPDDTENTLRQQCVLSLAVCRCF